MFLSDVWGQLGHINLVEQSIEDQQEQVEVKEKVEIKEGGNKSTGNGKTEKPSLYMFEVTGGKLWPQINDKLEMKKVDKSKLNLLGRAIGRMILHSLSNRFINDEGVSRLTIAGHVLPPPLRRYLLQGITPMDERYDIRDLFSDCLDFSVTEKSMDEWKKKHVGGDSDAKLSSIMKHFESFCGVYEAGEGSMTEKLRKATHNAWIESRSQVLDSLKAGLGSSIGNHRSLEAAGMDLVDLRTMDLLFFSKLRVTAEDVIKALKPDVGSYDEDGQLLDKQKAIIAIKDESTGDVEGNLVELLRKKEKEETGGTNFAGDFVEFTTGSRQLPQNGSKITIEFCKGEVGYRGDPESLPVAHTCNTTLKLPAEAYGGDLATLEKKMDLALASGLRNLSMK